MYHRKASSPEESPDGARVNITNPRETKSTATREWFREHIFYDERRRETFFVQIPAVYMFFVQRVFNCELRGVYNGRIDHHVVARLSSGFLGVVCSREEGKERLQQVATRSCWSNLLILTVHVCASTGEDIAI